MTEGLITCPPSPEIFLLHDQLLLPTEVIQKTKGKVKVKEVKDDLKAMAEIAASVKA